MDIINDKQFVSDITGRVPYRIALAGGWIDQPFVSKHNPQPPGSMVVFSVLPRFRFMDRAGFASSTRQVAERIWPGGIPKRSYDELVRELYHAENYGRSEPSGSQDMIGLIYPGINRLDYDFMHEDGIFPRNIESNLDMEVANWLEKVLHILPINQRPAGYSPLGVKKLIPDWIQRLGQSGKDCFDAIVQMNLDALGASFNECMLCWEMIFPDTVRHPLINIDLLKILQVYQSRYSGAMFSGCGGGYLLVVSDESVPGSFRVEVRGNGTD